MKNLLVLILATCVLAAQSPRVKKPAPSEEAPGVDIKTLADFTALKRKVCGAYISASHQIYLKGDAASEDQKKSYEAAAQELVKFQTFTVSCSWEIEFNKAFSPSPYESANAKELSEHLGVLGLFEINTKLPVSKEDLNEGSKFITRLDRMTNLPRLYFFSGRRY